MNRSNKKIVLQKLKTEKNNLQNTIRQMETSLQLLKKEENYIMTIMEKTKKISLNKGFGFINSDSEISLD